MPEMDLTQDICQTGQVVSQSPIFFKMCMSSHTWESLIPGTFSMIIYSAPTGVSLALEHHAYTFGAGICNTFLT